MVENVKNSKSKLSADWLLRGILTRLGEMFDKVTGRKWTPSSSLAASELIEKIKALLDSEARTVDGKGLVVPHEIILKMQWDKFSTDSDEQIDALKTELTAAVIDHINDSHYYTNAPVSLEIKTDYFTDGVRLLVGFGSHLADDDEAEVNVTVAGMDLSELAGRTDDPRHQNLEVVASFSLRGEDIVSRLTVPADRMITIGRTAPNSLIIDDPSVSKFHGSLKIGESSEFQLADTGSTNGTFVNGSRIAYGTATPFAPGDRVTFGSVDVRFELVDNDHPDELPDAPVSMDDTSDDLEHVAPEFAIPDESPDTVNELSDGRFDPPPPDPETDAEDTGS